jgi:hypothetical protein
MNSNFFSRMNFIQYYDIELLYIMDFYFGPLRSDDCWSNIFRPKDFEKSIYNCQIFLSENFISTTHSGYFFFYSLLTRVTRCIQEKKNLQNSFSNLFTNFFFFNFSTEASSPVMAYPPPFPTEGCHTVAPTPPSGYPTVQVSASPHDSTHTETKTKGEGFWKGWYV